MHAARNYGKYRKNNVASGLNTFITQEERKT